jgi:DNA repair exonuclease SbcCD ATPase subunit
MDVAELKGLAPDDSKDEESGSFSQAKSQLPADSNDELTHIKLKLAKLEGGSSARLEESYLEPGSNLNVQGSTLSLFADNQSQGVSRKPFDSQLADRVSELESQVAMISQKAVEQAQEAVKVIEALMKENAQLKINQVAMSSGFEEGQSASSLVNLKERNGILENQLDVGSSKVVQLESQIAIIKKELGQQLLEANSTIARLKVEGEAQERITRDSLFKEKQELEELRQVTSRQVRENEDGFVKAKEENLLLKDAKKLLEAKLAVVEDDFKNELAQAKEMVNGLVGQKESQAEQIQHYEQDVSKLKELNSTLIDRAKILQYELNRHRAQASGLERVCEDFKIQMEDMFNQVEQAKKDNNQLLQERINLEAGVVTLRTENSKLAERDKTYQQELEKTKEQINRFEKVYKNFKSNVGDASKDDSDGSR